MFSRYLSLTLPVPLAAFNRDDTGETDGTRDTSVSQDSGDSDDADDTDMGIDSDADGFTDEVDCDDSDPERHPDAPERCNDGVVDDCDGVAADNDDTVDQTARYADGDGDGFGLTDHLVL